MGGRMLLESVAGCAWNGWPDGHGISGRMGVEYPILVVTVASAALKTPSIQINLQVGDRLLFVAICLLLAPGFSPMSSTEGLLLLAGLVGGICFLLALRIATPSNLLILLCISVFGLIQAVIVLLLTAGISIYPWTGEVPVGARAFGVFQQPNVLASFMATSLACSFELLRNQRLIGAVRHKLVYVKTITWAVLLSITITTTVLVITSSRTGWLAGILVSSIYLLIQWPETKPKKAWSVICVLLGVALGFAVLNAFPDLGEMMAHKAGLGSARWTFYPQVLHLVKDMLPMGCGYGQFEICYVSNTAQRSLELGPPISSLGHPHNDIMYWVAQAGIFGLLAVTAIIGSLFRILWFMTKTQRAIWIALLLPIGLHVQLEYPFQQSAIHWLSLVAIFHIGQTMASKNLDTPAISIPGMFTRIPAILALIVVLPLLLHTIFVNWVLWSVSKDFESNSKYLKYVGHPGLIQQKYEFELHKKLFLKGVYENDSN
jgi:O-antigen polymerase